MTGCPTAGWTSFRLRTMRGRKSTDLFGDVLNQLVQRWVSGAAKRLADGPALPAWPHSLEETSRAHDRRLFGTGNLANKHALARDLAATVMHREKVPDFTLFKKNTAAFIHDLSADSISNVDE